MRPNINAQLGNDMIRYHSSTRGISSYNLPTIQTFTPFGVKAGKDVRNTATIEHYSQSSHQTVSCSVQKYSKAFRTKHTCWSLCILWWLILARKANTNWPLFFSRRAVVDLLAASISWT